MAGQSIVTPNRLGSPPVAAYNLTVVTFALNLTSAQRFSKQATEGGLRGIVLPLWQRLAAALSFLAVLAALLAPISMLAQEVSTGKLGGICSLNSPATGGVSALAGQGDTGSPEAPAHSHCDSCVSIALAVLPLAISHIPTFPGSRVAAVPPPAPVAAPSPGLPFSRGPPTV